MARSLRKTLLLLLALVALGALLYHSRRAVRLEGFRWSMLVEAVQNARVSLLLLAVAGIYVAYGIRALRWQRFARCMGRPVFRNIYNATVMGFACIFLLGRAGEPIRPLLIARKDHLPVASSFGVYVLERVMDTAATVVLAGVALLTFRSRDLAEEADPLLAAARTTGVGLLVGVLIVVALLVYFRVHGAEQFARHLEKTRARGGWRTKIATLFSGFSEGLQCIRTWGDLFWAIVYTAAHWLLIVLVYLWTCHSFDEDFSAIDFVGAMMLLAFTMVGSAVQLPGIGGGTQVAAFLVFTVIFGVEREPAAAAAIVLWLVTFAAPCLLGVPLLIREGWSMGELRHLARTEAEAEAAGTHATLASTVDKPGEAPQ
jgi:uncharacterized protein (TIRG00374 family)